MSQDTTISFPRLKVQVESSEKKTRYIFAGAIDDGFSFKDLKLATTEQVEFELKHVQQINSMGTREWILMLRQFNLSTDVHYVDCSVAMVDAFNSVPQLYENIKIESFFAPYFCSNCNKELSALIHTNTYRDSLQKGQAPVLKHEACQTLLEFDALEESYFGFIKTLRY